MKQPAEFARQMAAKTINRQIVVKFCATACQLGGAAYGPSGELA